MNYTMSMTDVEDAANRSAIASPLIDYNTGRAGPSGHRHLSVLVKDDAGRIAGGLWGSTGYDWLTIYLLVMPADARRAGLGAKVMRLAEREARARGCVGAWLDTIEFQGSRGFYERLGYACFGELADCPRGFSKFFMKKQFTSENARD